MTPTQQPATQSIEAYLADLRIQLAPITLAEREEILREIAAHIRDSFETGTPIDTVLARLGTPAELAAEYRDGQLIRAASRSLSPVTLLRATLRVATKGVTGILVFFCAVFGYFTGGVLLIAAIVKPFAPSHVGVFTNTTKTVWQKTGQVSTGIQTTISPRHDILGWWVIPLSLIVGVILLVTTLAIRAFLRLSQRVQRSLSFCTRAVHNL
jgi:uncharacterized membrane protein